FAQRIGGVAALLNGHSLAETSLMNAAKWSQSRRNEPQFAPYRARNQPRIGTELIQTGQVFGLLGNSGNPDGPHLHFHVMDSPSPLSEKKATIARALLRRRRQERFQAGSSSTLG